MSFEPKIPLNVSFDVGCSSGVAASHTTNIKVVVESFGPREIILGTPGG